MSTSVASSDFPAYRVNSALNRECLPATHRDPDRKIAWLNALCLSILLVGVLMNKEPVRMAFTPQRYEAPQQIVIAEPILLKPEEATELTQEDLADAPEVAPVVVVVVAADPSKVPFPVPVIGATLASADLRQVTASPPLHAAPKPPPGPISLGFKNAGQYGSTPWPNVYPPEAQIRREEGDVGLLIVVGADGGEPKDVSVEKPSGSSYLDLAARDWVRRNWRFLPAMAGSYRVTFSYSLPGSKR